MAKRATRLFPVVCALFIAGCASSPPAPAPAPTATQVTVAEAERAYAAADWANAARAYEQLVERSPQDAGLWFRLGNALARTEQPDRAVSAYRQALARDGGLNKAWFNLALVQLREAQVGFAHLAEKLPADDPMRMQAAEAGIAITTLLSNYEGRTPPAAPVAAPLSAAPPREEAPPSGEQVPAANAADPPEPTRATPPEVAPTPAAAPARDASSTASEGAPAQVPKATATTKKKPARKPRKSSPPATATGAQTQQAAPASGASEPGGGAAPGGTANDPRE